MTITFTEQEWERFVRELSEWRHTRDLAMEGILTESLGVANATSLLSLYREQCEGILVPTPIQGMSLTL